MSINYIKDSLNSYKRSESLSYLISSIVIFYIISNFIPFKVYNLFFITVLLLSLPFISHRIIDPIQYERVFIFSLPIFFLIILISAIYHNIEIHELDNYSRFLICIPIYFLFRSVRLSITALPYGIIIGSVFAGIISIHEYFNLSTQRAGIISSVVITYGNLCMTMFLFLIVCLKFSDYLKINRKLIYIALIMSLCGWLFTFTRGSLIGLFLCLPFLLSNKFSKNIKAKIIIVFLLSSTILISPMSQRITSILYDIPNITYNQTEIDEVDTSLKERVIYAKVAVDAISNYPLTGIGLDGFEGYTQKIYTNVNFNLSDHAHNDFLDIFAKVGFFGFISLLYLLLIGVYFFYFHYRNENVDIKYYSAIGILAFISQIGFMLTQSQLAHHQATLFFIIILVVTVGQISYLVRSKSYN